MAREARERLMALTNQRAPRKAGRVGGQVQDRDQTQEEYEEELATAADAAEAEAREAGEWDGDDAPASVYAPADTPVDVIPGDAAVEEPGDSADAEEPVAPTA